MNRLTEKWPDGTIQYLDTQSDSLKSDIRVIIDRLAYYEDAEEQRRLVVLPCKPNNAYWHRNYDTGQLELNLEMHDITKHDDTYPEINSCAYWE